MVARHLGGRWSRNIDLRRLDRELEGSIRIVLEDSRKNCNLHLE